MEYQAQMNSEMERAMAGAILLEGACFGINTNSTELRNRLTVNTSSYEWEAQWRRTFETEASPELVEMLASLSEPVSFKTRPESGRGWEVRSVRPKFALGACAKVSVSHSSGEVDSPMYDEGGPFGTAALLNPATYGFLEDWTMVIDRSVSPDQVRRMLGSMKSMPGVATFGRSNSQRYKNAAEIRNLWNQKLSSAGVAGTGSLYAGDMVRADVMFNVQGLDETQGQIQHTGQNVKSVGRSTTAEVVTVEPPSEAAIPEDDVFEGAASVDTVALDALKRRFNTR